MLFFRRSRGFLEHTLESFTRKTERALFAEKIAVVPGLLQAIDPRVKIVGLLVLIVAATAARNFYAIAFVFGAGIVLAFASRVPVGAIAARAWTGALFFTGVIAIPVIFITPGDILTRIPYLDWAVTSQGIRSALYLITRVETTVTLAFLLVVTTRWTHLLKALRVLRVPVVFVVILGMTYRYIFVMIETAQNMFVARRARLVGELSGADGRRVATGAIGVLLAKSIYLNGEVFLAMQSRGFRGEVYLLDEFEMKGRDWIALTGFLLVAGAAFWIGAF